MHLLLCIYHLIIAPQQQQQMAVVTPRALTYPLSAFYCPDCSDAGRNRKFCLGKGHFVTLKRGLCMTFRGTVWMWMTGGETSLEA